MQKFSRVAAIAALATVTTLTVGAVDTIATAAPVVTAAASAPTDAERAELIRLSDPDTLHDLHDGQQRIERIAQIFIEHEDRQGIFAVFYRNILRDANPLLDAGNFDDPAWAREVSLAFFHEYLVNLHGHLTGGPVTPSWQRYYSFAADPSRSAGRVAAAGLDAHLHIDFPLALAKTGTTVANTRDFFTIGDALIGTTTRITDELEALYGAKIGDFFHLFFLGAAADQVLGDGTTSYVLFQAVRATALADGLGLQNPATKGATELGMRAMYTTAETVFDGMDAAGLI